MSASPDRGYHRREATGPIQATHADGLRIDNIWWNNSRQKPVDLSAYRVGDVVHVVASETADGERRFILEIAPAGPQRAAPTYVDDLPDTDVGPDEWRDQAADRYRAESCLPSHDCVARRRLECLRIAASICTPLWVKKDLDPDPAIVEGIADQLVDWLYRTACPERSERG